MEEHACNFLCVKQREGAGFLCITRIGSESFRAWLLHDFVGRKGVGAVRIDDMELLEHDPRLQGGS